MAIKPIVNMENTVFDATKDFVVHFTWTGNQSFKNRILVINNETGNVVLDETIDSTKYNHTISGGVLQNGNIYTIQVQVYDVNDNASEISDKVRVRCISTPVFQFSNVNNGDKIETATYVFSVSYTQAESELLKEYRFYLYDNTGSNIVSTTEVMYSNATEPSTVLSYTANGLENKTVYYIQCVGKTVNGFDITTDKVKFEIEYVIPSTFSVLEAECDSINGYIKYNTNIVIVEYKGNEDLKVSNGMVDLRGHNLTYDQGFDITGDFVLGFKCGKLGYSTNILEIGNGVDSIKIDYYVYGNDKRFKLTATNAIDKYILYSEALQFTNAELVTIWIKRVENYYDLKVLIENDVFDLAEIYYCYNEPSSPIDEAIWIIDNDYAEKLVYEDDIVVYETSIEPMHSGLNDCDVWYEYSES